MVDVGLVGGRCANRRPMKRALTLAVVLALYGASTQMALETDRGPDTVEMIAVAGGDFLMGSDAADSNPDERPAAHIMVTDFLIDRLEVTNRRYHACVEADACSPPLGPAYDDATKADHAVSLVSWQQARS